MLEKKLAQIWNPWNFRFFVYVLIILKTIKFNLIKLETDFQLQPSYLVNERALLATTSNTFLFVLTR